MTKFYLNIIATIIFCFSFQLSFAQNSFKINSEGLISQKEYKRLINKNDIQLLSRFDTISIEPLLVYASYMKNDKFGIIDNYGEMICDALYDEIMYMPSRDKTYFHNYVVTNGNQKGMISEKGILIIPLRFQWIKRIPYLRSDENYIGLDSLLEAKISDSIYVYNSTGRLMRTWNMKTQADEYQEQAYDPYAVIRKENQRPSNHYKPQKSKPQYLTQSRWGQIGRISSNGFAKVTIKKDNRYYQGFVNMKFDKLVIEPKYKYISIDRFHRIIVATTEGQSLLDTTGKDLLGKVYPKIEEFNGIYRISNGNKLALFSEDLTPISDFIFDSRTGSANGKIMLLSIDGKWGMYDLEGKELIPCLYDKIDFYTYYHKSDPLFILAEKDNMKAFLSNDGKQLTKFEYQELFTECSMDDFGDSGRGFGDMEPDFGFNYKKDNAYYVYKKDGLYGLLDTTFKVLLKPQFTKVHHCRNTDYLYFGFRDEEVRSTIWGIYDISSKKVILEPHYSSIIYKEGFFLLSRFGWKSLADIKGNILIPQELRENIKVNQFRDIIIAQNSKWKISSDTYGSILVKEKK